MTSDFIANAVGNEDRDLIFVCRSVLGNELGWHGANVTFEKKHRYLNAEGDYQGSKVRASGTSVSELVQNARLAISELAK